MANAPGRVVFDISVSGGVGLTGTILDVELRMGNGSHDLVFIRMEYPRPYTRLYTVDAWPEGVPVQLTWGRLPDNVSTWYGYVNHHEISTNADSGSRAVQITYVLIGTSRNLNDGKARSWKNFSYSYIASKIAQDNGFRAVIHKCPNPGVAPYEAQTGETDFQFLNYLAEKAGYRTWTSGPDLFFVNPKVLITDRLTDSVPTFWSNKDLQTLDTIVDFKVVAGTLPGRTKDKKIIYGLDKRRGQLLQAQSGSGTSTQVYTDSVVNTYEEARRIIDGKQSREQNWIVARAQLFGSTLIRPNKLVYLSGSALPDGNEGFWMVEKVRHTLATSFVNPSNDVFISDVTLTRNDKYTVDVNDRQILQHPNIPCIIQDDQWKASLLTEVRHG